MSSLAPITAHPALTAAGLLTVLVPFAVLCVDQPVKLDYASAGPCLMGAVHFIFRG